MRERFSDMFRTVEPDGKDLVIIKGEALPIFIIFIYLLSLAICVHSAHIVPPGGTNR